MNLGTNSKLDTSRKTAGTGRNNNSVFFDCLFDFFFWENQRILLEVLYRHLDGGLVIGGEITPGELNHQKLFPHGDSS